MTPFQPTPPASLKKNGRGKNDGRSLTEAGTDVPLLVRPDLDYVKFHCSTTPSNRFSDGVHLVGSGKFLPTSPTGT